MMKKFLTGLFLFAALMFVLPMTARAATLSAPVLTGAAVKKSSHVTLSWKKVSGAAGYRIYVSVNGGKFRKLATVKRRTYTTKSLRPAKYTFAVRAARKSGSRVVLGKASKKVTRTVKSVSYSGGGSDSGSQLVRLAKKIGGMRRVSSRKYRDFAAKGNGVKIGYYKYAHYPNNIIYVKNTGNRALKIFGIRLGMTRAQALKASTHPSYDNGNSFGVHYAGVKVKYNRKGKISAMLYRLAPTS